MLKNLTNFFTLGGDYLLYGRTYKLNVWGCVALMALSALCGAVTDLAFDARGYLWQMVNCLFTAGEPPPRACTSLPPSVGRAGHGRCLALRPLGWLPKLPCRCVAWTPGKACP